MQLSHVIALTAIVLLVVLAAGYATADSTELPAASTPAAAPAS
jgi:hypothetical protein